MPSILFIFFRFVYTEKKTKKTADWGLGLSWGMISKDKLIWFPWKFPSGF